MSSPAVAPEPLATVEREALLDQVEAVVQQVLRDLEPDPSEARRPGPGRPRVLPAFALWGGVLVCVLRGMTSQRAVWRLLTARRLWHYPRFPLSDQAVYKRLAETDTGPLEAVFAAVSRVLADRVAPWMARDLGAGPGAVRQRGGRHRRWRPSTRWPAPSADVARSAQRRRRLAPRQTRCRHRSADATVSPGRAPPQPASE